MATPIIAYLGTTRSWTITLKNSQGVTLTNFYTSDDTLSASVWAGKDQAAIFSPSVMWEDPDAATVSMTITAAHLAAAGVTGLYRTDVTVTTVSDGQSSLGWSGPLQIEDTPGSAAVLSTYATLDDLTSVNPLISTLQSQRNDLAGFLAQRHEARVQFDEKVTNRYRPQPGRSRRLVSASHAAAGPYMVLADSGDASAPPTITQLKTWLSTSRLLVSEPIRRWNAYMAAALVFEDQITAGNQTANTYAALAKLYRDHAAEQWDRCVVEFDSTATVPAATPTHRIDRDVIFLT